MRWRPDPESCPGLSGDGGVALVAVVMGSAAIFLTVTLLFFMAFSNYDHAQDQRRDDTLLAGTEALVERYAAKLTLDGLYYLHWVDEAELPRRCSDVTSASYDQIVDPGAAWFGDCAGWTYEDPTVWYEHDLLDGIDTRNNDDVEALLAVTPPTASAPLAITVAARHAGTASVRSITTEIGPESISEYARMVETDLYYGEGADIFGKIYVGGDVAFRNGAKTGEVHADVFAHGHIGRRVGRPEYGPPVFVGDAEGWDSSGSYHDIAEVFPVPLDFDMFWDDLGLHKEAACVAGICLDRTRPDIPSTTEAYLVEFVGGGQLRISYATSNPSAPGCVSAEEVWWLESQDASWTQLGVYDLPANGALWADDHVVVGRNDSSPTVVDGALTIYAGTSSNRKNIIIGSDVVYAGGAGGTDVIGFISSDEMRINPNAVGTDAVLNVAGAILTQNGNWRTADDCGDSGDSLTPPNSTLNTFGSTASVGTGNMSGHFETRNYAFDTRLERLRPPFYPILNSDWRYTNWRETNLPTWATN